jgi:lipopolysaccharide export system permease protein
MSVLARYVAREQLRLLALCLGGLAAIHFVVDMLDNLRGLLARGVPLDAVGEHFVLGIPRIVAEVVPFAFLVATVLALGTLSARSEVIAMRAAGYSVHRIALPLLGIGLIASLMMTWAGLSFVPRANALAERVLTLPGAGPSNARFLRDSIWFRAGHDTVYGVRSADPEARVLSGVRILETDGAGRVARLTTARRMVYEKGKWLLLDGRVIETQGDDVKVESFQTRPAPLDRPPEALGEVQVRQEALSYERLSRYADRLAADGYDATRYKVELAARLSYPFACLVMVLVAIPHGLTSPRGRGIARGLGVSLVVAGAYWLLHSLALALGNTGTLPAQAAAWAAVAVFAAYGMYRLLSVRQ